MLSQCETAIAYRSLSTLAAAIIPCRWHHVIELQLVHSDLDIGIVDKRVEKVSGLFRVRES